MLIEAELLPQGPQFASNIPRFGEEPEKLTKMLPEPDNTILMSGNILPPCIMLNIFTFPYSHNSPLKGSLGELF